VGFGHVLSPSSANTVRIFGVLGSQTATFINKIIIKMASDLNPTINYSSLRDTQRKDYNFAVNRTIRSYLEPDPNAFNTTDSMPIPKPITPFDPWLNNRV
jgi:hypothetical protein